MHEKALIIYVDDDNLIKKTYSKYELKEDVIIFFTNNDQNKITIPISRLIKIKEEWADDKDSDS